MSEQTKGDGKLDLPKIDLVPSLREVVDRAGLNPEKLALAFEADGQGHVRLVDKHTLKVSDREKAAPWTVPSLNDLFRGTRLPPSDIEHYPPEYAPFFFYIENQFLTLCDAMGDRTDQEMEEIYSALRRRPDGRSLGVAHDYLWQVVALLVGQHVVSAAEMEAMLGALVRSTRKWSLRPISRNYAAFLRDTFSGHHSSSLRPI